MTEIVHGVRTVFSADFGPMQREMAAAGASTKSLELQVSSLERELKEMGTGQRVDPAIASRLVLERHKRTAGVREIETRFGLDEMEGQFGRTSDELGEIVEGWNAVEKAEGKAAASFKKNARDSIGGVDDMRLGIGLLVSNFGFVGAAVYGVTEALDGLDKSFSKSDEIARDYAAATKNVADELERIRQFNRGVAEDLGAGPITAHAKNMEDVAGTEFRKGKAEESRDRIAKEQARLDDLRRRAENAGIPVDDTGMLPAGFGESFEGRRARKMFPEFMTELQDARRAYELIQKETAQLTEMEKLYGQTKERTTQVTEESFRRQIESEKRLAGEGLARARAALERANQGGDEMAQFEAWERVVGQYESLLNFSEDRERAERENAKWIAEQAKNISEMQNADITIRYQTIGGSARTTEEQFEIERVGRVAAAREEKTRREHARRRFRETGEVDPILKIDARGSRITLQTQLRTDDPGRFADASLKAAFVGALRRPVAAVMGLGSAPLSNGRR